MARQTGPVYIEGTFDGVTYYQMYGRFYARAASSLDARRFKKDKAFKNSRRASEHFSKANQLAKEAYRLTPTHKKEVRLFRFLLKSAVNLFKQGKDEAFIRKELARLAVTG